jgi:hypothetical protein
MFITHQHMFDFITINTRTSNAVYAMHVNLLLGTVIVEYTNGACYQYINVSRRAILNLMLNDNMSLGMWVNENCKCERTQSMCFTN